MSNIKLHRCISVPLFDLKSECTSTGGVIRCIHVKLKILKTKRKKRTFSTKDF